MGRVIPHWTDLKFQRINKQAMTTSKPIQCDCGWTGFESDLIERREVADRHSGHTLHVYSYICPDCGSSDTADVEDREDDEVGLFDEEMNNSSFNPQNK
jgi:predicted RNA-binding Zn-ribbon protein involved in translation (DUF1610 family)